MGILGFKRFLHGLDSYERHKAVADFLNKSDCSSTTILDVGGETRLTTNSLALFLPGRKVLTANIIAETGIQLSGVELPLENDSCDAVVSIDTLEHIPKEQRHKAVEEYSRIARNEVIITAPLGSETQRTSETKLNDHYKKLFNTDHHYLIEHLQYGDPDIRELENLLKDKNYSIVYFGEIAPVEKHLKISFSFCPKVKVLNKLFKLIYTTFTLLDYKPIKYLDAPLPTTRRFLAHITL